jgi:hypothetical protein
MVMRGLGVLVCMFAVLKRRRGMFFRLLVVPVIMMMGCLMVMMCRGVMVCGSIVVMFARCVFLFLDHDEDSLIRILWA